MGKWCTRVMAGECRPLLQALPLYAAAGHTQRSNFASRRLHPPAPCGPHEPLAARACTHADRSLLAKCQGLPFWALCACSAAALGATHYAVGGVWRRLRLIGDSVGPAHVTRGHVYFDLGKYLLQTTAALAAGAWGGW